MAKSEDLLFIENCIAGLKNRDDIDGNLRKMERTISRMFDIKFEMSIANNETHKFFGMNIYPTINTINNIVDHIINERPETEEIVRLWQETDVWLLEIDSLLLYSSSLNANPSEITSILLHEIGHVIYSNIIPVKFNKIIRYKVGSLNYKLKALIKHEKIRTLFNLAIIEACTAKNYMYINRDEEKIADKFVVGYGYGEVFDEFINKLIATYGNALVNRTDKELEMDIEVIINWCINNIYYLEVRKSDLKTSLKVEMLRTPSDIIKSNVQYIYQSFFGEITDRYRELLSEQYCSVPGDRYAAIASEQYLMKTVERILKEATNNIFDKIGKLKKVNQLDIDILSVDADKIVSNDDKIYLLDRLYDILELVNLGIDYHQTGRSNKVSQSLDTLKRMREQLEKIRNQILYTKVIDKEYGVFIKYPKGYTG